METAAGEGVEGSEPETESWVDGGEAAERTSENRRLVRARRKVAGFGGKCGPA